MNARTACLITAVLTLLATRASADYQVTGQASATSCRGVVIKSCSTVPIDAVRGKDGALFEMTPSFRHVDEYKQQAGRCFINVRSGGIGLLSMFAEASAPVFMKRTPSGRYEEIPSVVGVSFPCRKVD